MCFQTKPLEPNGNYFDAADSLLTIPRSINYDKACFLKYWLNHVAQF